MKKLHELVELVSNTEDAVVLKVKPNSEMDLICLGCFNGDETMFRLTKGKSTTCTVWTKSDSHYSWFWGESGYTLVSDTMRKKGHMILECVEDYFDIVVLGSRESIITNLRELKERKTEHIIQLWTRGSMGCGCRKDSEFYRSFNTIEEAKEHFIELGYILSLQKTAPNACNSTTYYYIISK